MREVEATAAQGEGWRPTEVIHFRRGLRWAVLQVLDEWVRPGWPRRTYKKPIVERRYRLRVFGPLPGRPDQLGQFVMIATAYGNRDHFWIKPEERRQGDRPRRQSY